MQSKLDRVHSKVTVRNFWFLVILARPLWTEAVVTPAPAVVKILATPVFVSEASERDTGGWLAMAQHGEATKTAEPLRQVRL